MLYTFVLKAQRIPKHRRFSFFANSSEHIKANAHNAISKTHPKVYVRARGGPAYLHESEAILIGRQKSRIYFPSACTLNRPQSVLPPQARRHTSHRGSYQNPLLDSCNWGHHIARHILVPRCSPPPFLCIPRYPGSLNITSCNFHEKSGAGSCCTTSCSLTSSTVTPLSCWHLAASS
jgi:hypothetical protein